MKNLESYYAVIFTSKKSDKDQAGYEEMAQRMVELANVQNGFIGVESARDKNGFGITVSYWKTEDDIRAWKLNQEHLLAQKFGKERWYEWFTTRICKVEREYGNKDSFHE